MGYRNDTSSRGTPIHDLHSQIGTTGLRCISLVHKHRRTKEGGETTPLDVIGKADKTPSQIAMLSIFYQTRHEEMVSGNTTSSNLIPESGISFCIVKSKGVVIRDPIKPLHRINALVLDIGR